MVAENPGNITGWLADHNGVLRIAISTDGVNSSLLYRNTADENFETIVTTNFKEGISPLFFDFQNVELYALSNIGRDKIAIVKYNPLLKAETELLFEHPEVDIDNLGYPKNEK